MCVSHLRLTSLSCSISLNSCGRGYDNTAVAVGITDSILQGVPVAAVLPHNEAVEGAGREMSEYNIKARCRGGSHEAGHSR